ncbi:MAG: aminopeptidase [Candidatus Thermoplasmatota archaeon]|nr:aminopeptidase [Candidatus Thermoplasmatota archaeon]
MKNGESKYAYTKTTAWEQFTAPQLKHAMAFAEGYKTFLNEAKTEREAVHLIAQAAKRAKKTYVVTREKTAAVFTPGKTPIRNGLRIVIAHLDSPRLDLKQVPLYQDSDSHLALFETHYYGGIKKFHWVVIPLALHGVIVKKDGTTIPLRLGEDPSDPVFSVPDLLPHLSHEVQDTKKIDEAIKAESLDIVIGSIPARGDFKEKIKAALLEKLHTMYGISEQDFLSAELEAVPVFQARDVGFDRSLVGGYGQDDRISVYAALQAVCDVRNPTHAAITLFVDKEEIGSEGNTSAQTPGLLRSVIKQLDPKADVDDVLTNSQVISADVQSAVTPNYTDVFELKNAAVLGSGVVMSKFTGHGGKYSANDASAEYVAQIRALLDHEKIPWQTGELGKVDKGGGGTVAKYFSRLGMEVIDLGAPVLSMHSPYEVTSKVDLYSAYLAYQAFLKR